MIIKPNTYYKTRGGNLAYVDYYYGASIWKLRGKMFKDGDVTDQSWTEFGGVSGDYNRNDYKELYKEDNDLIKELPRDKYLEYYL